MSFLEPYRSYIKPVLLGALSALLFSSVLSGNLLALLLFLLAPFPLFISGLRDGIKPLTVSLMVGVSLMLLLSGAGAGIFYLFLLALPVYMLIVKALQVRQCQTFNPTNAHDQKGILLKNIVLEGERVTSLVLIHSLYGLLLVTGVFALFWKVVDPKLVTEFVTPLLEWWKLPVTEETVFAVSSTIPGHFTFFNLLIIFANGVVAHLILKSQGNSLIKTPDLKALSLPFWPWGVLLGASLVAIIMQKSLWNVYAFNVLLVLRMLFLLQGLSVAHTYVTTRQNGKRFLVPLYLFVFLVDWLGLLIAGLGVLEPWLKLRHRFANQKRGDR